MTFEYEPELRTDWRGAGDWDDMGEAADDRAEAFRLYRLEYNRQRRAKAAQGRPSKSREWPQDEIDLMIRLWREGKTAAEISRTLGTRSRCAVLGRLNRMGIARSDAANVETFRQGTRSGLSYKSKRGKKIRHTIGTASGRISIPGKTTAPVRSAEVFAFTREPAMLDAGFDAYEVDEVLNLLGFNDRVAA